MVASSRTRIVLIVLALATGCHGAASLVAEATALDRPDFPKDLTKGSPIAPAGRDWLGPVFPFRSDLEANQTLAAALVGIHRGKPGDRAGTGDGPLRTRITRVMAFAPYDAGLWLSLAVLEMRRDPNSPATVEALRMAYLTAPNDAHLMPVRLEVATRSDALVDPDLREFALGDVRIMLTRSPGQKDAVVSAYRRASSAGRAFLDEAAQSIDPAFLSILHS